VQVWVVMDEVQHEGGNPVGVFSTQEKAEDFVKQGEAHPNMADYRSLDVLEFELDEPKIPYWMQ
jgi:hypothetical protein